MGIPHPPGYNCYKKVLIRSALAFNIVAYHLLSDEPIGLFYFITCFWVSTSKRDIITHYGPRLHPVVPKATTAMLFKMNANIKEFANTFDIL